jgi:LmbE family N-acetylglucosaminyl deacetylase
MKPNGVPETAMGIFAHPDDAEFTVAGTVAKWAQEGCRIVYVLCTDGDVGTHDPDLSREKLAVIRRQEQRDACKVLGVQDVVFLGYGDGMLQPTLELRRDLVRAIRKYKPEVVLCGDPTAYFYGDEYINHPDHRAAAQAALEATFPAASMPLVFPELAQEGLTPHQVKEVYIWGTSDLNVWVDIAPTLELKIEALRQHRSQMGDWDPSEMITRWAQERAEEHGIELAESFRRMFLVREDDGDENDTGEEPEPGQDEVHDRP